MKEIFVSYSTVDTAPAETVRNVLEKNGFSCWMAPRDIPGGSNYTKEIPIAIRNCKIFLLILSKNAQSSHWVLKELDAAVNCGKVILPFMLEDCILNDEFNFLLTGAQRYAAYRKKSEAMETLIGRIRGILDVPDAPAPRTEPAREAPTAPAPKAKAPAKASESYFGEVTCSACGGTDLKEMPRRIKRHGAEWLTALFIPLIAGLCMLLVITVFTFLPMEAFTWLTPTLLLAFVGGGWLGNGISRRMVRNRRARNRVRFTCYRCNSCRKLFRHEETAE